MRLKVERYSRYYFNTRERSCAQVGRSKEVQPRLLVGIESCDLTVEGHLTPRCDFAAVQARDARRSSIQRGDPSKTNQCTDPD